ncbi:SRPBCC family protein [Pseudonocardia sp.]|jgi:uncharacterized protein YndB with AHSA1/START domain|uniref:SRPBCC family protein n=1 Tax=Pseudonocardia sp. TaxID=60912 RepID=UPI003D0BEF44
MPDPDPGPGPDPEFAPAADRWALRLERRYAHPVDTVWRAVTQPVHLAQWFPSAVEVDLRVGGTMTFTFGEGGPHLTGEVTALDPPRLLAFTWGEDDMRFELEPDGDGTRFVLVTTFDDRYGAPSYAAGWDMCLAALSPVLAGTPVPPSGRAVSRHEELVARFGLDRPEVTDGPAGWSARWERQLTCPAEVAWDLFLGGLPAPGVGEPFRAPAAQEVALGTVVEADRPRVLALDVAPTEPGDTVRLELGDGTGHGARLVLTVTGTDAGERDAAVDQWGGGAVAHVAAEAAAWASAHA